MSLSVELRQQFPSIKIDIAFTVPSPGITVLFGPSGSGKSTVVTAAAGLWHPETCRIALGQELLVDTQAGVWLPPERRRMGLVFQDSRLFPHMSVANNLMFGRRRSRVGRNVDFDEVVDLLGIRPLLPRRPNTLSGGERQRVAIGRALLAEPQMLLMDEPLASLDSARKAEILPFIVRLKTILRLPVLYVTHSLDELFQLADSVVLLDSGSVLAEGSVAEIAARADLPLARRDEAGAVLTCRVVERSETRKLTRLDWSGTALWIPRIECASETTVRVRVPAREVILARPDIEFVEGALSLHNTLLGIVRTIAADPERQAALVEVAIGGGAVLSRVTPDAVQRLDLAPGRPVLAMIKSMSVEVLGRDRGSEKQSAILDPSNSRPGRPAPDLALTALAPEIP